MDDLGLDKLSKEELEELQDLVDFCSDLDPAGKITQQSYKRAIDLISNRIDELYKKGESKKPGRHKRSLHWYDSPAETEIARQLEMGNIDYNEAVTQICAIKPIVGKRQGQRILAKARIIDRALSGYTLKDLILSKS